MASLWAWGEIHSANSLQGREPGSTPRDGLDDLQKICKKKRNKRQARFLARAPRGSDMRDPMQDLEARIRRDQLRILAASHQVSADALNH